MNAGVQSIDSAILLGESYDTALPTQLESDKNRRLELRFDGIYRHLYFVAMISGCRRQFSLLTVPDWKEKLLELLLNSDDEFVSIEKICRNLWNRSDNITRVNLSSLIYRLRKKMPDGGKCIKSIYGKGYYLSKNEIQMCV